MNVGLRPWKNIPRGKRSEKGGLPSQEKKPEGEGIWDVSYSSCPPGRARSELGPVSRRDVRLDRSLPLPKCFPAQPTCTGPQHVTLTQRRMQRILVINCFQISNKSHMHIHKHAVTTE